MAKNKYITKIVNLDNHNEERRLVVVITDGTKREAKIFEVDEVGEVKETYKSVKEFTEQVGKKFRQEVEAYNDFSFKSLDWFSYDGRDE